MGSCQNQGPSLGTLNSRCRIILGTQKGTRILTTTHIVRLLILHPIVWELERNPNLDNHPLGFWGLKAWDTMGDATR